MARRPVLAMVLAVGCGPIAGSDAMTSVAGSESGDALETSTTPDGVDASTGDGGWADCPSVRIDAPFAYRAFCLAREGGPATASGNLGRGGAPRFAFIGGTTSSADYTSLFGWDGAQVTEERFAVIANATSWGTVRTTDPSRDDLVGDALDDIVMIRNSVAGLEEAVFTTFPAASRPPVIAIDLDGDARDELVVGNDDGVTTPSLKAYRWNGDAWAFFGNLPPLVYGCGATQARRVDQDGDGRTDLAVVETCGTDDVIYVLHVVDEPLVFPVSLGAFKDGPVGAWQIADIDGDGPLDMVYEITGSGPRRLEIVRTPSADPLAVSDVIVLADLPLFVDGVGDCETSIDPWTAVQADSDGKSELMCGRTMLTSLLDEPVAIEAFASGLLGAEVEPHVVAHDLGGDGIDDLAITGRDIAGEPRVFILVSE